MSDAIDAALADGVVISYQYETTRLATPDGLTFQDATGVLWRVSQTLGWIGTVWTNSQDYSASSTGFTFEVVFAPGGTNPLGEQLYTNAAWGVVKYDTSMELAWVWSPPWSGGNAYPNGAGTGDTNVYTLATTEADGHFFSASLSFVAVGAETNAVDRVLYESSGGGGGGGGASLSSVSNVVNAALGAFAATGTVQIAAYAGESGTATALYDGEFHDYSAIVLDATNAAVAVVDAKISTNNAAFVSAVLAAPLVGADPSDLSELAEYGSYGTVGAAILALIAGLAALKRRMISAETAIKEKPSLSDLPYALVVPGSDWRFSGAGVQPGVTYTITQDSTERAIFSLYADAVYVETVDISDDPDMQASLYFETAQITATRTLPGHLADRAVNAVAVSTETTLTLPAANPGHVRDLIVRLTVSATSAVTWTVAQGESWDSAGAPPSSFAAGTYLYRFTEVAAGVWHCEDMLALVGLEAALAAINGGVAP